MSATESKKPAKKAASAGKPPRAKGKGRGKSAKRAAKKTDGPVQFVNFGKARPIKTTFFSEANAERKWWVVDLDQKILGRAASVISQLLRGKHKPNFTPNADTGDFVVAINAEKVRMTGDKWKERTFYKHTGYLGGIKEMTAEKLFQRSPEALVERTVRGMLPKNALGRDLLKKLKVYTGTEHPHTAQKPEVFKV